MKIYLIGSLKNPHVPNIGRGLRDLGHDVFDDWHAGGPTADAEWRRYHQQRGDGYAAALRGRAGANSFQFDMHNLADADAGLLIMPAGKSAHLELGWLVGTGRPGFIFFDREPGDWDLMYKIADEIFFDEEALYTHFGKRRIT